MRHRRGTSALPMSAVVVVLAAAALSGCGSGDTGPVEQPDVPQFMPRTSPRSVLHNMEVAYQEMRAEEYLDCLSLDFVFYPGESDVNDPENPIDPEWYKTDEALMHEHMFAEDSNVGSITLSMTVSDSTRDVSDPGDPWDDMWIYQVDYDLRLEQTGGLVLQATGPCEFHFRIDADQAGPNEEPLWEIFVWYDRESAGRSGESSWGGIKALYR